MWRYVNIFTFRFGDWRCLCFMCDCFGGRTFLFFTAVNKTLYFIVKEGMLMPDYKQLYLTLLDGVEKAINLLINTQKACEEIYVDTDETKE